MEVKLTIDVFQSGFDSTALVEMCKYIRLVVSERFITLMYASLVVSIGCNDFKFGSFVKKSIYLSTQTGG